MLVYIILSVKVDEKKNKRNTTIKSSKRFESEGTCRQQVRTEDEDREPAAALSKRSH